MTYKNKVSKMKEFSRVAVEISEFLETVRYSKTKKPLVIYYGSTRMQINSTESDSSERVLEFLNDMKTAYEDQLISITSKEQGE